MGNHTVNVTKTGYFNKTFNVSVSALDNVTYNITDMYSAVLKVYVHDNFTGNQLSNFTVQITGVNYSSFVETNNSNGPNNYTAHHLINGTYTLRIDATDYAYEYQNVTINMSTEVNISVYPSASLRVRMVCCCV